MKYHSIKISEFSKISCRINDGEAKKLIPVLRKAEKENKKLFGIDPKHYTIRFVYSNDEYDRWGGYKKGDHRRDGCMHKSNVVLFSPLIISRVDVVGFSYYQFFKHEINHIFYDSLCGSYKPLWFSEGMGTYYMNSYKFDVLAWKKHLRSLKKPSSRLLYSFNQKYSTKEYENFYNEMYVLSNLCYKYLLNSFGFKKIKFFLVDWSKHPIKNEFELKFEKHFKISFDKLIQLSIK